MRNRNQRAPHGRAEPAPADPHASGTSSLLRRLLQKVTGPDAAAAEGRDALPPAGRRSGSGAESVAPFLEETRNSRPAPLE